MDALFLKILNMSLTASWLILAVIIIRIIFKKAPKSLRCILWGLVGIRLICPFSFESILSLIPSTEPIPQNIIYDKNPAIESGIPTVNNTINPIITENFTPNVESSVNPLQLLAFIASIIWIVGIVAMTIYSIVSYLKLYNKVKVNIKMRDNIYYCDNISTPFILGIFKPRIYLPSGIQQQQTEYIIAHENAHIKRRDHWWKPLGFVLLSVYWFNPLVWVAYILLCKDIEMACDEAVIKNMDNTYKKEYSTALVECSIQQRKLIIACPVAFGEVSVKERIKSVLSYKKPALWVIIIAIITTVAVAIGFMTNPVDKIPDNTKADKKTASTSKTDKINLDKYYTLTYDDKNYTYDYEIRDKSGNVLISDKNVKGGVSISAVSENIIKRNISFGTGPYASETRYFDIENGLQSENYYGVKAEYGNKVIYSHLVDGNNLQLVVRDFFYKENYYFTYDLGKTPSIEPVSDVKIKDGYATAKYWIAGDDENDRWKNAHEETVKIDLSSGRAYYNSDFTLDESLYNKNKELFNNVASTVNKITYNSFNYFTLEDDELKAYKKNGKEMELSILKLKKDETDNIIECIKILEKYVKKSGYDFSATIAKRDYFTNEVVDFSIRDTYKWVDYSFMYSENKLDRDKIDDNWYMVADGLI